MPGRWLSSLAWRSAARERSDRPARADLATAVRYLLQLLVDGTVRPHEPAYDPEPDSYVTWDYCRGYADARSHLDDEH